MQLEKILERGFNRYNVPISIVIHTTLSVRFCHHEHHTLYGVYIWLISSESSMSTNSTIYIIHQLCPIKVAQKLTFWKKVEKFVRKLVVYQESWKFRHTSDPQSSTLPNTFHSAQPQHTYPQIAHICSLRRFVTWIGKYPSSSLIALKSLIFGR